MGEIFMRALNIWLELIEKCKTPSRAHMNYERAEAFSSDRNQMEREDRNFCFHRSTWKVELALLFMYIM